MTVYEPDFVCGLAPPPPPEPVWDDPEPEPDDLRLPPCTVCGSSTSCGYDDEGRPMIHATERETP